MRQELEALKKHADRFAKQLEDMQDVLAQKTKGGYMHSILPVGERPSARIEHSVLEDSHELVLENLAVVVKGRPDRIITPGTYTKLLVKQIPEDQSDPHWVVMMSDAPYEVRSSRGLTKNAHGHVLIAGLGLGATTLPLFTDPRVTTITVIEKNPDVIDLVYIHLKQQPGAEKMKVVQADAFEWKPDNGKRYDTIWLDIWPDVDQANLPSMELLRRKYKKYLRRSKKAWLGVWEETYLKQQKEEHDALERAIWGSVGGKDPARTLIIDKADPHDTYVLLEGVKVKI